MLATYSISRMIVIGLMALFVLAFLGIAGTFFPYVVLRPADVIPGAELWRLVTYPLATTFGSLIIGAICFSMPGEEMEGMLGKVQYGLMLLGITIFGGLLYTILFWGETYPFLAGVTNPALFIFVGYYYLFPDSQVRIFFFNVRTKILMVFFILFVVSMTVYFAIYEATPWVFFGEGGFGLLMGALYFHARYQKYPVLLGPIRSMEKLFGGGQVSGGARPMVREKRSSPATTGFRAMAFSQPKKAAKGEGLTDQERLDAILDIINEKGYKGLSKEEREFLERYSSKL